MLLQHQCYLPLSLTTVTRFRYLGQRQCQDSILELSLYLLVLDRHWNHTLEIAVAELGEEAFLLVFFSDAHH